MCSSDLEAQQALVENNLRHKIRLQVDGGLKTGLDIIKAAILGAESFGFGTGPMVSLGCRYLRICHLNNCATGIATQDDTLRSKRYYMENMEMGSRIFDKCVEKTTRMGLLERVPVSGMYDYLWHMDSYNRLVGILAELGNPFSTRAFCHRMFDVEKRTVASVSDEEVSQWKERHRKV